MLADGVAGRPCSLWGSGRSRWTGTTVDGSDVFPLESFVLLLAAWLVPCRIRLVLASRSVLNIRSHHGLTESAPWGVVASCAPRKNCGADVTDVARGIATTPVTRDGQAGYTSREFSRVPVELRMRNGNDRGKDRAGCSRSMEAAGQDRHRAARTYLWASGSLTASRASVPSSAQREARRALDLRQQSTAYARRTSLWRRRRPVFVQGRARRLPTVSVVSDSTTTYSDPRSIALRALPSSESCRCCLACRTYRSHVAGLPRTRAPRSPSVTSVGWQ